MYDRTLGLTSLSVLIRLVLDDGTGEAHVWVSGALVRPLLGLNDCQWEGLQRVLRVRGQVEVYPWGQNLVSPNSCLTPECTCVYACVFSRCVTMLSCTSCCVCAAVKLCVASSHSPAGNTTDRDQKVTEGTQTLTLFACCHGYQMVMF